MDLKKLIKKDTEILTKKIHAGDYINTKDLSYRKELVVIADKMEGLIMELKPYVSNEQFIELMRDLCDPTNLHDKIKPLVSQLYRQNPKVGYKALELQIFLEITVIDHFCGAYDWEDYTYSMHSVKNVVLKETIAKAEAKVKAKNYLKYNKGATEQETVANQDKAIKAKIESLKLTLQSYLGDQKFDNLDDMDDMEKLGYIIPDTYAAGNTKAFNTTLELRAVIDCLKAECDAHFRALLKTKELEEEKEKTALYDSYVKDYKTEGDTTEHVYVYLHDFDPAVYKCFKKLNKIVSSKKYFKNCTVADDLNATLFKKLGLLIDELKPHLTDKGYQVLTDALRNKQTEDITYILDSLYLRLDKRNKAAGAKALEIQALINYWLNAEEAFYKAADEWVEAEDESLVKKVMSADYLKYSPEDDNDELGKERPAILRKINALKLQLKPFMSKEGFNTFINADILRTLDIIEGKLHDYYHTHEDLIATETTKELRALIKHRLFGFMEQVMPNEKAAKETIATIKPATAEDLLADLSFDNTDDNELQSEIEDIEDVEALEKRVQEQATYNSYIKDCNLDFSKEDEFELYSEYHNIEDKYYKEFREKFSKNEYIPARDFEKRRQIINDKLNAFKAELKPYLTKTGYQKLFATNPVDLSWFLDEFGERFNKMNNTTAVIATAKLRAFAETVVRNFAEQDMKIDDYQKKVMTEEYLGDYQNYSTATYQKMHELKTALKPYLPKKEYLKLLVDSPLETLITLGSLIPRFYYDEHNNTATSIAIEIRKLIQCRIVECYRYDF